MCAAVAPVVSSRGCVLRWISPPAARYWSPSGWAVLRLNSGFITLFPINYSLICCNVLSINAVLFYATLIVCSYGVELHQTGQIWLAVIGREQIKLQDFQRLYAVPSHRLPVLLPCLAYGDRLDHIQTRDALHQLIVLAP